MTSPAASGGPAAPLGGTSDTYRSPNRVLGISRAETPRGICAILSRSRASCTVAPDPSVLTDRTVPTFSPRTFTSARGTSWVPTRSTFSVTGTSSEKAPA
jgi:hypothetical protein